MAAVRVLIGRVKVIHRWKFTVFVCRMIVCVVKHQILMSIVRDDLEFMLMIVMHQSGGQQRRDLRHRRQIRYTAKSSDCDADVLFKKGHYETSER